MQKKIIRSLASAVAVGILFSVSSATMAATDSASSDITLQFTPTINVALIDNITIANPASGNNAVGSDDFCIGGFGFSTFSITFASNDGNNDTAFTLTDGADIDIPYSVGFDNSISGTFTDANEEDAITGQTRNASSCNTRANARFQVTVANSDWETAAVLNGTSYTDTLLVTVASE